MTHFLRRFFVGSLVCVSMLGACVSPVALRGDEPETVPPAREEYLGRQIAQTMHWLGAEWLVRDSREREERCSLLLTNLGIRPGMTVCDMGCGNGFYTLKMAKLVGEEGKVYAVDIQPEMLKFLQERAEEQGIENVVSVQGKIHDPMLPPDSQDLILVVDVYHEFSHPEQMLEGMRNALKPDGVIALAEYRAEDPKVPIKPLHKMTKKQILKEYAANELYLVREFDRLPWQHLMFFGKDRSKEIEANFDWDKAKNAGEPKATDSNPSAGDKETP